jgi:hypothetical protein
MSALLPRHAPSAETNELPSGWRIEPRHQCPRLARVRPLKEPKALARLSIVRNVSTTGIGLFLTHTLEPGALLDVELRSRLIVNRVAQVVHSVKQEGGWLIGCTLDSPLSASELEALRS